MRYVFALTLISFLSLGCGAGRKSAEAPAHSHSGKPRAVAVTLVVPNLRRDWTGIVSLYPDEEEYQPIRRIPLDVLLPAMVGSGLAPHLRLDQPIYAFMFTEEKPPPGTGSALLSIALDDCEATLADLGEDEYRTFSSANGVTGFEPLPDKAVLFEKSSRCEIWPLPADTGCRLICGQRADLESQPIARWASTVVPSGKPGDWFYASFNLSQLRKEAFVTLPAPTSPGQRMGQKLAVDAVDELGNVGMGMSADANDVRLRLDLEFTSSRELLTGTLLGRAVDENIEDAFLDLPEESLLALRLSGTERGQRRSDVRLLLEHLLNVSEDGSTPEMREERLNAMSTVFFAGGPSIWAWGFDFQRARIELRNFFRKQGSESSRTQQLARAWRPWVVFGFVEADGAAWLTELDRAMTLLGEEPPEPPAKNEAADAAQSTTSFRRTAPNGAPKGTRYFLSRRSSDNPVHVLLMPKKEMVWGCAASAVEICMRQLSTIQSKNARTLRDTPWAEALKAARGSLVGVTSPLGLAALTVETEDAKAVFSAGEALDVVGRLPDDGDFPLVMVGTTTLSSGSKGTLSVSTRVPKTAIPYELLEE